MRPLIRVFLVAGAVLTVGVVFLIIIGEPVGFLIGLAFGCLAALKLWSIRRPSRWIR